jgi:hypothetical protein
MSAALLQRLADAGTPMHLIMEVAETLADATAAQRLLDRRREKDRNRKRISVESEETTENAEIVESAETPSLNKSPQTPKINPTPPTHTRDAPARKAEPFPKPDWADPQVWADLLTNRRKKNLPNTASAHRKLMADVDRLTDDHWPPGRVLEAAVSRGWGGIYAGCKDDDDERGTTNRRAGGSGRMGGHQPSGDGLSPTTRAALRVFGVDPGHPH